MATKSPKPVVWIGDARDRVRDFPEAARARAGFELWEVQQGKEPSDWKPMPSVGIGVSEIRVHADGEYRVLYVAKFAEAVYVLHAFGKKTRKTASGDIELARTRYRAMLKERKQR
ncbi:MAG: type II toxin-antitoxin system RelE/ParE family toxin [Bryobacteraceae bacterium]|nr:type II toxin-antitoxin system RelE/ParE family toxin [Bryobacteraceae bacterium]